MGNASSSNRQQGAVDLTAGRRAVGYRGPVQEKTEGQHVQGQASARVSALLEWSDDGNKEEDNLWGGGGDEEVVGYMDCRSKPPKKIYGKQAGRVQVANSQAEVKEPGANVERAAHFCGTNVMVTSLGWKVAAPKEADSGELSAACGPPEEKKGGPGLLARQQQGTFPQTHRGQYGKFSQCSETDGSTQPPTSRYYGVAVEEKEPSGWGKAYLWKGVYVLDTGVGADDGSPLSVALGMAVEKSSRAATVEGNKQEKDVIGTKESGLASEMKGGQYVASRAQHNARTCWADSKTSWETWGAAGARKTVGPRPVLAFLGIKIDSEVIMARLPEDKQLAIALLLGKMPRKDKVMV
ncbi:hypothetical protein NDU88_000996 [Pleurodeles waltl]|uniref:Uncharacterized protein n=1 Tax=Pleurodeles waltl TaxID=8319 RepID=A0AAV7L9R7_PLEWA|nr:hypothetical protein NDU88_000996 [Pleurodeles waltl]